MPIETIPDLLAAYARNFAPERAEGINGTVQLRLSGDGGGDYVLTFAEGTYKSEPGVVDNPTVEVSADAQDWIQMSLGKSNPMMLMMSGKLKVKGSIALATKFQSLFKT